MKRFIYIFIGLIGLISLLSGCEKDETKVVILENPVPPAVVSLPDLTLERVNAANTIVFTGTPVDPGFQASATYFFEVAASGSNFANPLQLYSGRTVDQITFLVSEFNSLMLRRFRADEEVSVDFRIRARLTVDAGTGAAGTSSRPMEYISAVRTATVMLYGLPRLDLINSGMEQRIESAAGDGIYSGYVKMDPASPFTLIDPDTDVEYGALGAALAVNGQGIIPDAAGWHKLTVNTVALTYTIEPYMVGLVGSATPNGWDSPDQKMDYDRETDTWYITIDLIVGHIKFRRNDGWGWELGHDESGSITNLIRGGYGNDIPITEAGNYTITLTIIGEDGGSATIVKNN